MHIHATASGEEVVYDTCGNSDNELNDDVLKGVLAAFPEDAGRQSLFFWI